jgi:transcriptional regulator with XRE-family HTH domain
MNISEREERVRELRAQGLSQNAIARLSGIPRRTVQRIIQRLDQGSSPTPSSEPWHESGPPPMGEYRRQDAAEVGAETIAPPPRMEALPHIARQLHDAALRICQIEAQQLRDTEIRARQAEEALPQALQAFQAVRAEQWRVMRTVTQSVGELLQATGQLLQHLPEASG